MGMRMYKRCKEGEAEEPRKKKKEGVEDGDEEEEVVPIKGILHQKIFYCLNLIFWIVMGCGIARFGRKGLKTTKT